jgi:hypothetical protein
MPKKRKFERTFTDLEARSWRVDVRLAGSSNAMVLFRLLGAPNAREDRYAWFNSDSAEARSVTSHLNASDILRSFTDDQLALLFRKSMLIAAASNPLGIPVTQFAV